MMYVELCNVTLLVIRSLLEADFFSPKAGSGGDGGELVAFSPSLRSEGLSGLA